MGLRDWAKDAWDKGTDIVEGGADVLGDVGGALVNEEAWGNLLSGNASWSDLANVALDASILIPGAGLAGGAARIGARQGAKMLTKEAAEAVAKKEMARTALRSPANNAVRSSIDDLLGLTTKGSMARAGAKEGTEYATKKATRNIGRKAYADAAKKGSKEAGPLRGQMNRMAAKQEAGIGKKYGFGQTKRRTMLTGAATLGANLGTELYDNFPGFPGGPKSEAEDRASGPQGPEGYGPGTMFIVGSGGEQIPMPAGFANALAAFMKQNGVAEGAQVISTR